MRAATGWRECIVISNGFQVSKKKILDSFVILTIRGIFGQLAATWSVGEYERFLLFPSTAQPDRHNLRPLHHNIVNTNPGTLENNRATSDAGIMYAGGAALADRKLKQSQGNKQFCRMCHRGGATFHIPLSRRKNGADFDGLCYCVFTSRCKLGVQ